MSDFGDLLKSLGKTVRRVTPALLAAVAFAFTSAWTADAVKGAAPFYDWQGLTAKDISTEQKIGWAVTLLALSFVSALLLYASRRTWMPVRSLGRYVGKPQKVLVICLSTPNPKHKGFDLGDGKKISFHCEAEPMDGRVDHLLIGSINDDIQTTSVLSKQGVNWQQSLRAIHFHSDTLERLVIVPSLSKPGDTGSEAYIEQFLALLAHYQSRPEWSKPFSVAVHSPVDYEDFEKLHAAFMSILNSSKSDGFKESEIVFDITAGQKVPSVAAAMVTLTTRADFQYVQTFKEKDRKPEIMTYSVVAESPPDV